MSTELPKNYDPKAVEDDIYQRWLDSGSFHAEPAGKGGKVYSVVIPPPNVTAALHLGHALNNTLQDILVRWKRMEGYSTLWMPGTDHAGIATQTVVEKRVLAEEHKRRTDFGREEFVAKIQRWKDEYESRILGQLRKVGCSCDWDRTRFTMDEVCAKAVRAAFFKLFADGLIYRGKRLVNWDPATQTVLADDEVEYETIQGHFWYLRYPLTAPVEVGGEKIEYVTVATTRPETMLGDTAVAMNPRDPYAGALVGKTVRLPIVGREIPIIADEYVVLANAESDDPKARYATGFLKVTPAHDPNDWAIGQRHGLSVVNVMAPDGTISDQHGWIDWEQVKNPDAQALIGLDRFKARKAIVAWFEQKGLLEEVRDYAHEVGHSYRSHVPIEPYLSDQWFIAVKKQIGSLSDEGLIPGTDVPVNSLAGLGLRPLLEGQLHFVPERYSNNYRTWLENYRDWPISRQLWWGHRIPVWSKAFPEAAEGVEAAQDISAAVFEAAGKDLLRGFQEMPFHSSVEVYGDSDTAYLVPDPTEPSKPLGEWCDIIDGAADEARTWLESHGWVRDNDVLDTWFSSGLWPLSTMLWPEETPLLNTFYPTSVLCTAREIITLWVSRMVIFGQYFRGSIPFRDVYIHAMIQDGQGRKMSKSLGNGIDPLDIVESHGADAMRFTLAFMTTETQDVRMPVEAMTLPDGRKVNSSPKFDLGRNFCNKLWNASRFAMMNLAGTPAWSDAPVTSLADQWILSRLTDTIRSATSALEGYRYHDLAETLYRFMWNDFCDWYLEIAKIRLNAGDSRPKALLAYALDSLLRLLHPVIPFITERIWEQLNEIVAYRGPASAQAEPLLVKAAWPRARAEWLSPVADQRFGMLQTLISGIREARNVHNAQAGKRYAVTIVASGDDRATIEANLDLITALAQAEPITLAASATPSGSDATVLAGNVQALVHDLVDKDAELVRLTRRKEQLVKGIAAAEGKLGNANFAARAPAEVVAAERQRLAGMKDELVTVTTALEKL